MKIIKKGVAAVTCFHQMTIIKGSQTLKQTINRFNARICKNDRFIAIEPDSENDWKKAKIVTQKFEKKYGICLCVSFIKNEDVLFIYDDIYIRKKKRILII